MTEVKPLTVAMIVAMADNGVIGRDNQLPWHLPNDLKYFKTTTLGKPIVMGRKTFESIGRPLPGRPNIVVTTNTNFCVEGVHVAHSIDDALAIAAEKALEAGVDELMIIGGAQLYGEALSRAGRLYLTRVHADVAGDAKFPSLDMDQWQELSCQKYYSDESNPYDYSFVILQRAA
jgi:dihydrofolate reductase